MRTLLPITNDGQTEFVASELSKAIRRISVSEDADTHSPLWAIKLIVNFDSYYNGGIDINELAERMKFIAEGKPPIDPGVNGYTRRREP